MSVIVVCALAVLVPLRFLARPAAALSSSTTAEQQAGAIVAFVEGLDARPRRHSKSVGYNVQAAPGANLKTSKSGHAAGASCQLPNVRAPCHQKLPRSLKTPPGHEHTRIYLACAHSLCRCPHRFTSTHPFVENVPLCYKNTAMLSPFDIFASPPTARSDAHTQALC